MTGVMFPTHLSAHEIQNEGGYQAVYAVQLKHESSCSSINGNLLNYHVYQMNIDIITSLNEKSPRYVCHPKLLSTKHQKHPP